MDPATRERLLDAMLGELAAKGYEGISLAETLMVEGIPETDFAAEFASVDECLFAAYGRLTERLAGGVGEACANAAGEEWPQRVRAGLEALLEVLAVEPRTARVLTRSFPSIGPEAHRLYLDFAEGFAPMLREGREFSGMGEELPVDVELLAVGAAEAIVFEEIEAGRAAQLPALGPEILFSVLAPFLGPDAASAAMAAAKGAAG
jgi:AcrR family transcriptional regulator